MIWEEKMDINVDLGKVKDGGRKFPKIIGAVAVVLLVLIAVFSSIYSVGEQENGVVVMFGKVVRTDTAGLHFKLPFLQQVRIVDMTTHGFGIGYDVTDGGQNVTVEDEGIMITSDFNFVDIDFYLEYKVNDPVKYIYNSSQPEAILKNAALAAIRSTVSDYTVDDVITTGKSQIQAEIRDRLYHSLEKKDIGLQVVNIQIQDAEPPTSEIVQAFKAVETAKQGKETSVNNAKRYQNEQIPQAEAQADQVLQQAEAAKEARIAEAQGQAERFNRIYEEYAKYPDVTKKRLFYETMEDVLPQLKVIVTDGSVQSYLPLTGADMTEEAAVLDDAEPAGE